MSDCPGSPDAVYKTLACREGNQFSIFIFFFFFQSCTKMKFENWYAKIIYQIHVVYKNTLSFVLFDQLVMREQANIF